MTFSGLHESLICLPNGGEEEYMYRLNEPERERELYLADASEELAFRNFLCAERVSRCWHGSPHVS